MKDLPYRPCAGIMLINGAGLVFAGQRLDNPGPAWQMPQGGIDAGETPQQAAMRELGEETGIGPQHVEILAESANWISYDLPADLAGKFWKGRYRGQTQKWFLMRLTAPDTVIRIDTKHPEFSRWQWMEPRDLPGSIVPFKREVYHAVLEEFLPLVTAISGQKLV